MTRRAAAKLHNGDQVIRKSDGAVLRVTSVVVGPKSVYICAVDERTHALATPRHTDVR